MDTVELEQRLDGGQETQSFEVKGPMAWTPQSLAKDILAMTNLRDGGLILIGVEDQTFARVGVSPTDVATYKIDEMRDQMTAYADPSVDFKVEFPRDESGTQYVAIRVASFLEMPVICRRDSADTRAGAIYYRTTNRRVESAPVSNSSDMREIITVAASRTRNRLQELGWSVDDGSEGWHLRLDDELDGL